MKTKIAIMEDDPFTKHMYSILMKKAGYEAYILEDADLLMQKLEAENIVLIIMDINLRNTYLNDEKIDGIRLTKYIKSQERYSSIPVILVSAFSFMADKKSILEESKAHQYITKPITDFNAFINTIKETIVN
ncbi:MAG TPA: response regulator [Ignavibacteria bacterium]|nr:response regulator [Ignavibacteria bacterium]